MRSHDHEHRADPGLDHGCLARTFDAAVATDRLEDLDLLVHTAQWGATTSAG